MSASPALARCLAAADGAQADAVFIRRFNSAAHRQDEGAGAGEEGPLRGVPVTVKDNFDVAGYTTTAGSRLLGEAAPAAADAPVVAGLRAAGAVLLGHTNMTEFAFSGLGINPHYGTPRNPAFTDAIHIPGGSSSGAAVSVALGIAPVALGTDTGGSVRIPAAFCGLVGFKPSADQVSTVGVLPLSPSLDSVGVIATSAADCGTLFDLLRAPAPATDRQPLAPGTLRLALVRGYVDEDLESDVQAARLAFCRRLREGGIALTEISVPELAAIAAMNARGTLAAAEAYAWHRRYLPQHAGQYDPRVLARIERGALICAETYQALQQARAAFISAFNARIAAFDAVLWPTTPLVAPLLAELTDAAAYDRCNLRVLRNSAIVNLADGCAISLPCPDSPRPCGMTLAAAHGRDGHLLQVAAAVEALVQPRPPAASVCLGDFLCSGRSLSGSG